MGTSAGALITPKVIEELNPALFKFALRAMRRREDAEDVVQETWFSALRNAPTFEGRSTLRSWLTAIMRRRIADHRRRTRPSSPIDENLPAHVVPVDAEPEDLRTAAMIAAESLGKLLPLERTAVALIDVEDLEREEAAERMHVTRGHLRVLLHRGRNKLEHRLEAQGFGAEILG